MPITTYRALCLAAAALSDSKRVLEMQREKYSPEFLTEMHDARDEIFRLRDLHCGNATPATAPFHVEQKAPVLTLDQIPNLQS
jgi:hypothetical protein